MIYECFLIFWFKVTVYSEFDTKTEISNVNLRHRASIAGDITETEQRTSSAKGNETSIKSSIYP